MENGRRLSRSPPSVWPTPTPIQKERENICSVHLQWLPLCDTDRYAHMQRQTRHIHSFQYNLLSSHLCWPQREGGGGLLLNLFQDPSSSEQYRRVCETGFCFYPASRWLTSETVHMWLVNANASREASEKPTEPDVQLLSGSQTLSIETIKYHPREKFVAGTFLCSYVLLRARLFA